MAEGCLKEHVGEAIVLRSWPFQEADLLVSLFTRDQGRIKGVARHAMRSRRRFGGALEPMTHVRASYAERPRQELMRLDAFETIRSPLRDPIDWERTAGLQFVAEVLEEALPELAPEDALFRLAISVLDALQIGRVLLPSAYFCFWVNRLMGWMPELRHCVLCGLELRGETLWWSPSADGIFCADDRRNESVAVAPESVWAVQRIFRLPVAEFVAEPWSPAESRALLRWGTGMLERHLERRMRSLAALGA